MKLQTDPVEIKLKRVNDIETVLNLDLYKDLNLQERIVTKFELSLPDINSRQLQQQVFEENMRKIEAINKIKQDRRRNQVLRLKQSE